jgi:hypothetical protein
MKNPELTNVLIVYKVDLLIKEIFCEPNNQNTRERLRYKLKNGNWSALEKIQIKSFLERRQAIINESLNLLP